MCVNSNYSSCLPVGSPFPFLFSSIGGFNINLFHVHSYFFCCAGLKKNKIFFFLNRYCIFYILLLMAFFNFNNLFKLKCQASLK